MNRHYVELDMIFPLKRNGGKRLLGLEGISIVAFRQQFKVGEVFSSPTAVSYFGDLIMLLVTLVLNT